MALPLQDVRAKYEPGPTLGRGAFGVVFGCIDRATKERFACKSIGVAALLQTSDGPNAVGRIRNEISIMSSLAGHPNVRVCVSELTLRAHYGHGVHQLVG